MDLDMKINSRAWTALYQRVTNELENFDKDGSV